MQYYKTLRTKQSFSLVVVVVVDVYRVTPVLWDDFVIRFHSF